MEKRSVSIDSLRGTSAESGDIELWGPIEFNERGVSVGSRRPASPSYRPRFLSGNMALAAVANILARLAQMVGRKKMTVPTASY